MLFSFNYYPRPPYTSPKRSATTRLAGRDRSHFKDTYIAYNNPKALERGPNYSLTIVFLFVLFTLLYTIGRILLLLFLFVCTLYI
jgi:hypothetical protein